MPIRMLFLVAILIATGACTTIKNLSICSDFDDSVKGYTRIVRWHELETAGPGFAAESVRDDFSVSAKATRGVEITDYRIISQECKPEKKEGKVVADIDYFIPPSVTVKTVEDVQRWEYVEEDGKKSWRLKSLLPDFK